MFVGIFLLGEYVVFIKFFVDFDVELVGKVVLEFVKEVLLFNLIVVGVDVFFDEAVDDVSVVSVFSGVVDLIVVELVREVLVEIVDLVLIVFEPILLIPFLGAIEFC